MKLKTLVIAAATMGVGAVAANAEMIENSVSTKLINMYAIHNNGSDYTAKDEACKGDFGQFMDQEVSVQYKLDTTAETGEGTLTFAGGTIPLTPVKMGDAYGFVTDKIPDAWENAYIDKITVTPGATSEETRAEFYINVDGSDHTCVAASHGQHQ